MKFEWLGHACFAITLTNGKTIITDPHDNIGYPPLNRTSDIITVSHQHHDHNAVHAVSGLPQVIQNEGVHKLDEVEITGVQSFHDNIKGARGGRNLIYVIAAEGLRICHLGDLGHLPDEGQIKSIGRVDVLMVPVGGFYTIDDSQAAGVVEQLLPKYILPMHYKTDLISFPISGPDKFLAHYPGYLTLKVLEVTVERLPAHPQAVLLELA